MHARTVRLVVAGLTTSTMALGAGALAPAAVAGGDHGDDDPSVVLALTDTTVDRLTGAGNTIRALGAADKDTHDGDVYLSFPVRDSDGDSRYRGTHDDDGDRDVIGLLGALGIRGAGPDATWSAIKVNLDNGVISAKLNRGDRAKVLRVAGYDDDHDDHDGYDRRGGGHGASLELTKAGAGSLNAAVPGSPFKAGDTFAGDSDGCS